MKLFSRKKYLTEDEFRDLKFKKMSELSKATIGGGFSAIGIVTGATAIVNTASIVLSYITQLKASKLNTIQEYNSWNHQKNSFLFYQSTSPKAKNIILS